eukprot:5231056-Amphidinium_carterae.1
MVWIQLSLLSNRICKRFGSRVIIFLSCPYTRLIDPPQGANSRNEWRCICSSKTIHAKWTFWKRFYALIYAADFKSDPEITL